MPNTTLLLESNLVITGAASGIVSNALLRRLEFAILDVDDLSERTAADGKAAGAEALAVPAGSTIENEVERAVSRAVSIRNVLDVVIRCA